MQSAEAARAAEAVADMFVYRDTGDDRFEYPEPDAVAAAEREAAYWYGPAEAVTAEREPAEPARGPFEPLHSGMETDHSDVAASGTRAGEPEPDGASDADEAEPSDQRARKLDQIKDFYLTAEAIGEDNVDKHFDQLLAQQRELISEYFKQSATRKDESGRAGAEPTEANAPGIS
jgi:hypothetical protein